MKRFLRILAAGLPLALAGCSGSSGPAQPVTKCNGQQSTTAGTVQIAIIDPRTKCLGTDTFVADSNQEAFTCADNKYGAANVVTNPGTIQTFVFTLDGGTDACRTGQIASTSSANARQCLLSTAGAASATDVTCQVTCQDGSIDLGAESNECPPGGYDNACSPHKC